MSDVVTPQTREKRQSLGRRWLGDDRDLRFMIYDQNLRG